MTAKPGPWYVEEGLNKCEFYVCSDTSDLDSIDIVVRSDMAPRTVKKWAQRIAARLNATEGDER